MRHARAAQPALAYTYFNMDDPVVGGYTPDKIALRRAIVMGFNTDELIRVWYQGQAIRATQPIPPVVAGHSEGFAAPPAVRSGVAREGCSTASATRIATATAVASCPTARRSRITMGSATAGRDRERDELWKKNMTAIGIRIDFVKQKWPDLLKMGARRQAADVAGRLDHPVRRGRRVHAAPVQQEHRAVELRALQPARVRRALREDASAFPTARSARRCTARMAEQIVAAYNPWDLGVYRVENTLVRPWVDGYKKHVYREHPWLYLDVDPAARKAGR